VLEPVLLEPVLLERVRQRGRVRRQGRRGRVRRLGQGPERAPGPERVLRAPVSFLLLSGSQPLQMKMSVRKAGTRL
jgi:hypothetical protein